MPRSAKMKTEPQECRAAYTTNSGEMFVSTIENYLETDHASAVRGKVDLIFTSPPFPLVRKKAYGNEDGEEYLSGLRALAPRLAELLSPTGSIVLEVGNAWERGEPFMSTLPLEVLLEFKRAAGLQLCQHIICHNPARLPSPAQWVTITRCRLKDSFTHVWWMSKSRAAKADNRRVLLPYGEDMKRLLDRKSYNAGKRPSGHVISEAGFLTDHGGAISASVLEFNADNSRLPESLMRFSGTGLDKDYSEYCQQHGLKVHPARMQRNLAAFFISFLTEPGDLVFDPFAGSNVTGATAEALERRWIGVERNAEYAQGSRGRFPSVPQERR